MQLIILTGVSGSGKSIALNALEDQGFYCVDNLPATLLSEFVRRFKDDEFVDRVAVGVDSRNRHFLEQLPGEITAIEEMGVDTTLIYVDASIQTLLKRYKESRRPHPLHSANVGLQEAIKKEQEQLQWLRATADTVIDTTEFTPHELRRKIKGMSLRDGHSLYVQVESFGYRHGIPIDADMVFDVRCLPNPHWEEELRPYNGTQQPIIEFLTGNPEVEEMFGDIINFTEKWLPAFKRENRSYLTIAIGCTGGKHRSVYLSERIAEYFKQIGQPVHVRHRELESMSE